MDNAPGGMSRGWVFATSPVMLLWESQTTLREGQIFINCV